MNTFDCLTREGRDEMKPPLVISLTCWSSLHVLWEHREYIFDCLTREGRDEMKPPLLISLTCWSSWYAGSLCFGVPIVALNYGTRASQQLNTRRGINPVCGWSQNSYFHTKNRKHLVKIGTTVEPLNVDTFGDPKKVS